MHSLGGCGLLDQHPSEAAPSWPSRGGGLPPVRGQLLTAVSRGERLKLLPSSNRSVSPLARDQSRGDSWGGPMIGCRGELRDSRLALDQSRGDSWGDDWTITRPGFVAGGGGGGSGSECCEDLDNVRAVARSRGVPPWKAPWPGGSALTAALLPVATIAVAAVVVVTLNLFSASPTLATPLVKPSTAEKWGRWW